MLKQTLKFVAIMLSVVCIYTACSTNIETVEEVDEEQLTLDSLAQVDVDLELIEAYITSNNLSDDYVELENGVRYYVWQPEETIKEVKSHDIVSLHTSTRLMSGQLISTTILSDAITGDSIQWADEGLDFSSEEIYWEEDTLKTSDYTTQELLEIRENSIYPLSFSFSGDFNLEPLIFGYVASGSTVDFNFSVGFRSVIEQSYEDLPIELGTRLKVIVPSASSYRLALDQLGSLVNVYVSSTEPVVYDAVIANVRP